MTRTASGATTLASLKIAKPAPPYTYLGVAENLMPGVQRLAGGGGTCAFSLALVAAHTLECLLKAHLSRSGSDDRLRNHTNVRHNLAKLWAMAAAEGLPVPTDLPDWVQRLR